VANGIAIAIPARRIDSAAGTRTHRPDPDR
jgi:hypothetical protein